MADPIGQRMGGFEDPRLTKEMEDLYGLRMEEFYRGIAPASANRIYGPRQAISPANAAALKLDLTKVYKDLAKISQEGSDSGLDGRIRLQVAAMQAAAKVQSARETAEGKVVTAKIQGDMSLAAAQLPMLEEAMREIDGGELTSADKAHVDNLVQQIMSGTSEVSRGTLFDSVSASESETHGAAQDGFLSNMDTVIAALGADKKAVRRVVVEVANRTGSPVSSVSGLLRKHYKIGTDSANKNAKEALRFDNSNPLARIERIETSVRQSIATAQDHFAGGGNLSPQTRALLSVVDATGNAGPAGVQVPPEVLQELNLSADQMNDPSGANAIRDAAAFQIEALFKSINEGSEDIPYIQKQINALKGTASLEGSGFREYLKEQGFNPDNPAHVDVGFGLLEEDYSKTRKYETKQAKLIADTSRFQRRHQRERSAEVEHQRANRMPEGGVPEEGAEEMIPMEREVIQNYGPSTGELTEAGEAPQQEAAPAEEAAAEEPVGIIPLGKLEGDTQYEYAFDADTQEFIGYLPGSDPSTGSRFQPDEALAQSNPALFQSLLKGAIAKVKEASGEAPAPEQAAVPEQVPALQGQNKEGIGVRESQTQNMEIIEKRLRANARDARKRAEASADKNVRTRALQSADHFEEEADRFSKLGAGVSYREAEAQFQGVGTGFETEDPDPFVPAVEEIGTEEEGQDFLDYVGGEAPVETQMRDRLNASTEGPLDIESQIAEIEQRLEQKRAEVKRQKEEKKPKPLPFQAEKKAPGDTATSGLQDAARKRLEEMKRERTGTP